ncbi:MAG TPA: RdgB/HAM1 family non-canonical purine NTP pyrophosphatase [Treponemataceae bacterium]|nr:RdgB/HAM1 family non-canonical purine NTP pyrophosphatase [Treponemataceae bacterium]HPS44615.1 RdgB/HAM1 family non-canonical purine NTP pyrophosphatase [Treponemataceae bacterium]
MKIYFATGNAHKREELARILSDHEIVMPSDEGIAFDPEETEATFFGNSVLKARALYELTHCPVIADDSGLCVDALDGAPGILSARYGSEGGKKLDSTARNELLLSRMRGIENRTCRFVCNMVLYLGPDRFFSAQETLEGSLIDRMRGSGGFGYDPLVLIPELGLTVAELSPEKKDELSHRGKAGRVIARLLSSR